MGGLTAPEKSGWDNSAAEITKKNTCPPVYILTLDFSLLAPEQVLGLGPLSKYWEGGAPPSRSATPALGGACRRFSLQRPKHG